jgi:hypothetical protein
MFLDHSQHLDRLQHLEISFPVSGQKSLEQITGLNWYKLHPKLR